MYPIDKYKFYIDDPKNPRKVYAVSTFAGKTVRGVSKCDSRDTFSQEKGKELAAARCGEKVAKKRLQRAEQKYVDALAALRKADAYVQRMENYLHDAQNQYDEAQIHVNTLFANM